MTRAQEVAIEKLEKAFLGFYGYAETKEVKTKNVSEWESGVVYLQLEVGRIGDEGTMGEVFGRNELAVCIGKQGGYFMISDSKSHYRKTFSSTTAVICKCQWR